MKQTSKLIAKPANKLRISGGRWRSRVIPFPDIAAIRPTPARIRETLFNWLNLHIQGASCLEPYCGSGILSIEALSRGAAEVTLLDIVEMNINAARKQFKVLTAETATSDAKRFHCYPAKAQEWLSRHHRCYDIIFLDPPFASDEMLKMLQLIYRTGCLQPAGFIYIESAKPLPMTGIPAEFTLVHHKQAASVHYGLCQIS